ncbi:hypothetical protein [Actinomadura rayongensis]|uniref:Uncharacterized protein n=1 Tax=Actinomadura rayongensis TaxID=1429076 RepID=A0A6I4WDJ8_9ACTN|nr:hypothetical protein [Actinomadura rayongensis]MXQ66325.1 hypothetical protein [Actinomadura rayongensis]
MITGERNALCLDGPYHGALVRVEQDVGAVEVPDPTEAFGGRARYRITRERVHHPSRHAPFVVLRWTGDD